MGPLADQVPLELGQGTEDVKDELPAAGGRVDRLLEAAEADLPRLQDGDRLDQVLERAPQPVELPNDESVAGPEEGDHFGQSDAFVLDTAGDVGEELLAAGLLERVLLEIEVLVLGRDTRIADEHPALV